MLKDNFYTIIDFKEEKNLIHTTIELNEQHEIFKGHFPHQPVVPGVCWLQIAKEIVSESLSKNLFLNQADNIKFLKMLHPYEQKNVDIRIEYSDKKEETIDADIVFQKENMIFCKIKCSLHFSE